MSKQLDQFLISRIRGTRDHHAFERIMTGHKKALLRFLEFRLPTVADAEDALSTTMLRTWNYLVAGSHVENLPGLIYTIAKSVVAEFYRSRRPSVSTEMLEESGTVLPDHTQTSATMEARVDVIFLQEKLKELSDEERDIIVLKHFEGLSIQEIAERLEKSVIATRVTLHRALKKLRGLME